MRLCPADAGRNLFSIQDTTCFRNNCQFICILWRVCNQDINRGLCGSLCSSCSRKMPEHKVHKVLYEETVVLCLHICNTFLFLSSFPELADKQYILCKLSGKKQTRFYLALCFYERLYVDVSLRLQSIIDYFCGAPGRVTGKLFNQT